MMALCHQQTSRGMMRVMQQARKVPSYHMVSVCCSSSLPQPQPVSHQTNKQQHPMQSTPELTVSRSTASIRSGRIDVIMGPMFAGKSTELLKRARDHSQNGMKVALVKPYKDTRYSQCHITTHDGVRSPCFSLNRLSDLKTSMSEADYSELQVIAIDEAQFFEDLVEFVAHAAEAEGKIVQVAGLDGDFKRNRFGHVLDLVPLADAVVKLTGRCQLCEAKGIKSPSLFSLRIVADDRQELIGGADSYVPACRTCYTETMQWRDSIRCRGSTVV